MSSPAGCDLACYGEDVTLPVGEGSTPTRVLGAETATRRLDQRQPSEYRPATSPTRRPAPRIPQTAPEAAPARRRGGFSRFMRFLGALIALVLIAVAVAAAVIILTDKAEGVKVGKVAGNTVDKVVEEVKDLIKKNTK